LLKRTPAEEKVFLSRSIPTDYEDGTIILIYSTGETSAAFDESPKRYRRRLAVRIECLTSGNDDDNLDAKLEELGDRVESLMEVDDTFGGLANSVELTGSSYQTEDNAQSPMGLLALLFEVEFFTYAIRPELQCLDDLKTIDTKWKIGHDNSAPDNVVDAEDTANLES